MNPFTRPLVTEIFLGVLAAGFCAETPASPPQWARTMPLPGVLAVIDPKTRAQTVDIPLDGHPESFQMEPRGPRLYANVPPSRVAGADRNTRTRVVVWNLPVFVKSNDSMGLDEADHRLIGTRFPPRRLVLDTESGHALARLPCAGNADDVFYDTARKRIYVSGGAGSVAEIRICETNK